MSISMLIADLPKVGDTVRTNYSETIYTVKEISDVCTCPNYLDTINGKREKLSKPHYHFVVKYPDGNEGYLAGYQLQKGRILNVWNKDEIFILKSKNNPVKWPPVKKPGRKAGSAIKLRRINMRTDDLTMAKLNWIREHSTILHGKSEAAVIEALIDEHQAVQQFFNSDLPRLK